MLQGPHGRPTRLASWVEDICPLGWMESREGRTRLTWPFFFASLLLQRHRVEERNREIESIMTAFLRQLIGISQPLACDYAEVSRASAQAAACSMPVFSSCEEPGRFPLQSRPHSPNPATHTEDSQGRSPTDLPSLPKEGLRAGLKPEFPMEHSRAETWPFGQASYKCPSTADVKPK